MPLSTVKFRVYFLLKCVANVPVIHVMSNVTVICFSMLLVRGRWYLKCMTCRKCVYSMSHQWFVFFLEENLRVFLLLLSNYFFRILSYCPSLSCPRNAAVLKSTSGAKCQPVKPWAFSTNTTLHSQGTEVMLTLDSVLDSEFAVVVCIGWRAALFLLTSRLFWSQLLGWNCWWFISAVRSVLYTANSSWVRVVFSLQTNEGWTLVVKRLWKMEWGAQWASCDEYLERVVFCERTVTFITTRFIKSGHVNGTALLHPKL